jgi:hypothetical protein
MPRVEAVRQGRRRRSARRRRARTRRVPRPTSGRRTSNRGSRRRRAACRAPQRARRRFQGTTRREPPTRRGRAETYGDVPLPSTWVDDASRCSGRSTRNRVLVAHRPEDTPGIPRVHCDRCQLGDSIDCPLTRPRPRARVVQSSHRATGARAARRTGCLVAAVQRQHHGRWVGRLQVHVSVEDVPPPFGVVLLDGPLRRWWENADPRLPLPRRRPHAGRFHSRRRLDVDRGRASPKPEGNRA